MGRDVSDYISPNHRLTVARATKTICFWFTLIVPDSS